LATRSLAARPAAPRCATAVLPPLDPLLPAPDAPALLPLVDVEPELPLLREPPPLLLREPPLYEPPSP